MTVEIYYFTGTGNSLALARHMAKRLGNDVRLISLEERHGKENGLVELEAEVTGLVFPVYCFGMPLIVARFISRIASCRSHYVFGLANCAGIPGFALKQLHELLASRQIRLNASLNVTMPSNYLPFGGAWAVEKQQRAFARAEVKLDKFASAVNARQDTPLKTSWLPPVFLTRMLYNKFAPTLADGAQRFKSTSLCTSCGLCARICPTGNIELNCGRPHWGKRCEQCMACIQWCPVNAIRIEGVKAGKKHYHHPEVDVKDLL